MRNQHVATVKELSDAELDLVAAGSRGNYGSLVNLNNLVNINLGIQLANQSNIAVFSTATQGGSQSLNLNALAVNYA